MTPTYFDKVRPTYIESWNTALAKLSVRQTDIPLNPDEVRALGLSNRKFKHWFGSNGENDRETAQVFNRLTEKIGRSLDKYPGGAFVRLGSRSGKDSVYADLRGLRVRDADTAIKLLTGNSRRIAFDLRLALIHNYRPHIFVREWHDIPVWAEFRCFMRNRKLVGMTQYDCKNLRRCPEIAAHASRIKTAIIGFFEKFSRAVHLEDVVFDVFVKNDSRRSIPSFQVTLLELNPFFGQTDACLFDWDRPADFDGSLRFL